MGIKLALAPESFHANPIKIHWKKQYLPVYTYLMGRDTDIYNPFERHAHTHTHTDPHTHGHDTM